jgi:hypothetical protein
VSAPSVTIWVTTLEFRHNVTLFQRRLCSVSMIPRASSPPPPPSPPYPCDTNLRLLTHAGQVLFISLGKIPTEWKKTHHFSLLALVPVLKPAKNPLHSCNLKPRKGKSKKNRIDEIVYYSLSLIHTITTELEQTAPNMFLADQSAFGYDFQG